MLLFTGNVGAPTSSSNAAPRRPIRPSLIAVAEFRQLLARRNRPSQYSRDGRVCRIPRRAQRGFKAALAAGVALRAARSRSAARHAAEAEATRPPRSRSGDASRDATTPFDDFRISRSPCRLFRGADQTGKYYWIPTEPSGVGRVRGAPPPRDLVWRRANMVVTDGPDGVVYHPGAL